MSIIARILFELSPFNEFWSAWCVGFCVVGADGKIYRTEAGDRYLEEVE